MTQIIYCVIIISVFLCQFEAKKLMGWLCLDICDSKEVTTLNLEQIFHHKTVLSAISFEKYTLGPNSTLSTFNFSEVASTIQSFGLESWPMLTSWPHPPEFMEYMRQVFQNPKPFFDSCISEAQKYGYSGYNLDFEPTTDDVTIEDGNNYAAFIDNFATILHENGFKLQVDVATWTNIWNYTAINLTSVDYVITMGTYASTRTSFSKEVHLKIAD